MENVFSLKEKINKISNFIDSLNSNGLSSFDKEILLQKLKDLYFEVSVLSVDNTQIVESVEKRAEDIIVDKTIVDEVLVKAETNEKIIGEEVESPIQEPIEIFEIPQSQAKEDAPQEEVKKSIKKEVVEQASLFPPDNNHIAPKIVGEQLRQNKTSLNEILAQQSSVNDINARLKPISDIRSAIGVGDRFLFIKELFSGSSDLFEETIANLNSMLNYSEAVNYLSSRFKWDEADSSVISFLNIVKRRYVQN